jgi:hypothetical protein
MHPSTESNDPARTSIHGRVLEWSSGRRWRGGSVASDLQVREDGSCDQNVGKRTVWFSDRRSVGKAEDLRGRRGVRRAFPAMTSSDSYVNVGVACMSTSTQKTSCTQGIGLEPIDMILYRMAVAVAF